MGFDDLLPLAIFAIATVITPGPNNVMLMASGANFGLKRSVPHMLGIVIGFPAMIALVGLGVMQVFDRWPWTQTALTALATAYLLWLAWKIATATAPKSGAVTGHPLRFWQAAAFQWVNPKAWSMALSAITLFAPTREIGAVLFVAGVYVAAGTVSSTTWTIVGEQIRRFLSTPGRLRAFNWTMAAALVLAMLPTVFTA